ncbi:hypothetical protein PVAND_016724 [Polypedilum vanderplanki]|uniref:Lipase domain-containing protein n=1 Tax=Polypedilum vanderplanki TaxID=319348 RepID=A0A9J6BH63_POLVA|nr:hypothetical protein PVAND_016724 [Polypedilum vanderplanki]
MKTLILCIALFAGAFSLPIDEEKHRWTLVPDQEGRMHLLDMNPIEMEPEPAFNANNDVIFLLFTRRNRNAGQRITFDMNTVRNSNWIASQGARFIIHGWNSNQNTAMNNFIRQQLLDHADHNVVVVDWGAGAQTPNYLTARNRVGEVGATVATMMNNLVSAGLSGWNRINVIGHSLGGHVAGHTGKRTNGRIQAIFATDPAGPLFNVNSPNDRLAAGDAVYTEALHTNAGTLGFDEPITTASFYPNWGSTQPGCGVDATGACAHERSNLFYSESVRSNRFVARRCTGYAQITARNCPGSGTGIMGGDASKSINGVFFLETNAASPFARG